MKKIFLSAILAGAVIAFGGTVFLSVENTVVGSLFFTIGLFVVCTRGLHLFTGKVCYVFDNDMAYAKTLPVIWLGNLAGTSLIALAEKCTRLVSLSARAQGICELKLSEPLFGAFILAVFCNVMIYIGVEGYRSNPHELGKYLALFFGVCVFILCGFEHCVANMYYFTMGGAWSGYIALLPGAEQLLGGGLDGGTSYEVELSAEDTVGNVRVVRYTAATSRVTLHLRAGGMGAAFGKYAEQEALECVWPAVFYGDVAVSGALTVNGQTVEAMLFPVGSVRLTDSPAAPETPAGAAWESVETGIAGVYGWRRTT